MRWGSILVATAFVVWGALIGLSYAQWGRVTDIIILDNPHIDAQDAEQKIQEAIATHWPIMGNHDRHWTLPRKKIESIMKEQSNTIRSVDMKYRDHSLVIDMDIFTPAFLTCFADTTCGFTSYDGYVYDPSPEFSPGVYTILEVMGTAPEYNKGPQYLSESQRAVVDRILLNTQSPWGNPHRVMIDLLDIHMFFDVLDEVRLPEDSYIVISQQHLSDYETYFSQRLNALRSKTNFFERLHDRSQTFQYLDLRFDDKMYMKFQ